MYHLVAGGETNWCDYARFVVSESMALDKRIKLTPDAIRPIPASEYPTAAKRPANSRLVTSKFRKAFNLELPDWTIGVRHVLQQVLRES